MINLEKYIHAAQESDPLKVYGRVVEITGIIIKAVGVEVSIGEMCRINSDKRIVEAEVVGFKDDKVLLMPLGDLGGIRPGSRVIGLKRNVSIKVSDSLIGRVIDGLGNPIDGKGPILGKPQAIVQKGPDPLKRRRINDPIDLGVRAINGLVTCGKGQRVGIMSATGVGKSVLLGMIARFTEAHVNVIALIGERSREVREFLETNLGDEGLKRSVVVVTTSESPPLLKIKGAFAATAVAEYFRSQGNDVLLMMDSLTRVAMAQREVGLAVGEPPTTKGYTPSTFTLLPKLLERVGTSEGDGSITGLYSVLVEGDDLTDPVADSAMSVLDGHIVLSRELAMENHFPPVAVLESVSRVMWDIIDDEHKKYASKFIDTLATYKKFEDMINIGAYKEGTNPKVDYSIKMMEKLKSYLMQGIDEKRDFADSLQGMYMIFGEEA